MVSTRRLISKRVTKALHFRKVLENEGFEVSKKWPSVKVRFSFCDFEGCFEVKSKIKMLNVMSKM